MKLNHNVFIKLYYYNCNVVIVFVSFFFNTYIVIKLVSFLIYKFIIYIIIYNIYKFRLCMVLVQFKCQV